MNDTKVRQYVLRALFYFLGLICVTLGMALYAKTGLGVSCIIALPFSFSNATGISFSRLVFVAYASFVVLQMILKGKDRQLKDALQFFVSFAISLFLGWFSDRIDLQPEAMWQRLLVLMAGIVLIGLGMSLMMNMHIIVNPADGLVQTMSAVFHKNDGFCKNIEDICCVTIAVAVDLIAHRKIVSVGLGTLIGMICVGRVVALCNILFIKQLMQLAGVKKPKNNLIQEA